MPAAVLETAGRVLVRGARRLCDPVEGQPLDRDHLAHLSHDDRLRSMTFARLSSSFSRPMTSRWVHSSSCIASTVMTARTPSALGCRSTTVRNSYGLTPGIKSASERYAIRFGGANSVKVFRDSVVNGIPALCMNSTCSGAVAVIA